MWLLENQNPFGLNRLCGCTNKEHAMDQSPKNLTQHIASNINSLHRDGVLQEMKRLYLEEIKDYFTFTTTGEKVLRKEYSQDVPCPICGTSKDRGIMVVKVNGFEHRRCPECSNVYVSPRLKDEYVWAQYARPSYDFMFRNLIENTIEFRKEVIAKGKFEWVVKRLKNKEANSLLDIGSGLGENLAVYKEHGWDVVGIEFNEYAAVKSRKMFGVTVLNTPIEEARLPREQFDVISLWGVMEHLTDPLAVLRQAFKHLAPDGVVVIMVPQFNCLLSSYLQDYPKDADRLLDGDKHLVLFTREGIEYIAKKLEIGIVDIATRGLDIVTILNYTTEEKETRLHRLLTKELSKIQRGIEDIGFGDHLWVIFSKK